MWRRTHAPAKALGGAARLASTGRSTAIGSPSGVALLLAVPTRQRHCLTFETSLQCGKHGLGSGRPAEPAHGPGRSPWRIKGLHGMVRRQGSRPRPLDSAQRFARASNDRCCDHARCVLIPTALRPLRFFAASIGGWKIQYRHWICSPGAGIVTAPTGWCAIRRINRWHGLIPTRMDFSSRDLVVGAAECVGHPSSAQRFAIPRGKRTIGYGR
jgi:hypothetical protein